MENTYAVGLLLWIPLICWIWNPNFTINFNFLIINFPFNCSNITVSPTDGVYISQLKRYSRPCTS